MLSYTSSNSADIFVFSPNTQTHSSTRTHTHAHWHSHAYAFGVLCVQESCSTRMSKSNTSRNKMSPVSCYFVASCRFFGAHTTDCRGHDDRERQNHTWRIAREQRSSAGVAGGRATELLGVRTGRAVLPSLLATCLRDLTHPDGTETAQLTTEKPRLRSVVTCPKPHASDEAGSGLLAPHLSARPTRPPS